MPAVAKTKQVEIEKITAGKRDTCLDSLVVEEPLEILVGYGAQDKRRKTAISVTMRTPGHDAELALGFLITEGIIGSLDDVVAVKMWRENAVLIELDPHLPFDPGQFQRNFYATSSCGICGKAALDAIETVSLYRSKPHYPTMDQSLLCHLPETLRAAQATFETTGGLHAAGLFDAQGQLLLLMEDIGRHNAVDKVIGAASKANPMVYFNDKIMLVSGRAGFELVQKCSMVGMPILAAVGAPSSLSVDLAEASGMTLIGFLRGERFNIYTGKERISD